MRVVITTGTDDPGACVARVLRREGFEVRAVDGRGVPRCIASRHRPSLGDVTACGVSTREESLVDSVAPFCNRLHWRGPVKVDLKHDSTDGRFKAIESNPRVPGFMRLASACGVELPALAARGSLEEEPVGPGPLCDYRAGTVYVAPTLFARCVAHEASARGWIAVLSRARADASGSWPMLRSLPSDPLPIITRTLVPQETVPTAALAHKPPMGDPSRRHGPPRPHDPRCIQR